MQKNCKRLESTLMRYRLMEKHRELVKGSEVEMGAARNILHFLITGKISLGYSDADCLTEIALEKAGVHFTYSGRSYIAHAYLKYHEQEET